MTGPGNACIGDTIGPAATHRTPSMLERVMGNGSNAMDKIGGAHIVYGDDVESLVFPWGMVKILSEPAVTGAERMSFGMVVLAPGAGHDRHNHPGAEEIIYVLSGEGEQMLNDQPPVHVRAGASIY